MVVYKGKFIYILDNIPPKVEVDGLLYCVHHLINVRKKSEENHSELGAIFLLNIIFNKNIYSIDKCFMYEIIYVL